MRWPSGAETARRSWNGLIDFITYPYTYSLYLYGYVL